ncbi:SixA phosphatase family protein [Siansivirga zeaxanthinifaciens]|uniref:Phosphohistidine phosphatase n=1 Tax=Siansivirga zeaxanthinifaciens CC-SAMT-1 TaxID=1454006 RepID=A0A0C5WAI4_9FLAO|nr:histidine phosphatase family protein [Siansivirga zeaxanthinifaciens]AJR04128.1 phosphohistidine phosphatase [Siansivirga zeaxanthinifaciens CC-SAMT-1]
MKKLILIRHAKSSWKFNVIDHERPLETRGLNDALLVSKHLLRSQLEVDLVLCSDAIRTKKTAEIFNNCLKIDEKHIVFNHDLYDFEGSSLLKVIKSCNNSVDTLMVFGHNHALTYFVNTFGDRYIDNVPTSGVVIIEFNIDNWKDLKQGKTLQTLFPKDFRELS